MPRRQGSDETQWHTKAGDGGWIAIEGGGERVAVRVEPDTTGRYRVRELHLRDTGEPVTAERLRAVRVAALEQLLNLPQERAEIDKRFDRRPSVDVEAAVAQFGEIPQAILGALSVKAQVEISSSGTVEPTLKAPGQRGYSDDFYEQVAETYRNAIRSKRGRPVMAIAAEAGVPRSTAARWVKEARRRHKLGAAPATGKAGG